MKIKLKTLNRFLRMIGLVCVVTIPGPESPCTIIEVITVWTWNKRAKVNL